MPHFIVEYSANLEDRIDLPGLADDIRDAALETGVFPLAGIRVRFHPCPIYTVADGRPDAAFIHVTLRMGAGRDDATRKRAGDALFEQMRRSLGDSLEQLPLALSFEIAEIEPVLTYKDNRIRGYLEASNPTSATEQERK